MKKSNFLNKKVALVFGVAALFGCLTTSHYNALAADGYKVNVSSDFNDPNKPKFSKDTNSNAYDLYKAQALLNIELAAEGIALLDNKDNFLPMTKNDTHANKISIFGKQATKYSYAPVGAGDASNYSLLPDAYTNAGWGLSEEVTLYDAFRGTDTQMYNSSGVSYNFAYFYDNLTQSFEINEELVDFYMDDDRSPYTHLVHGSGGGHFGHYKAGMPIQETNAQAFYNDSKNVTKSFEEYNDAAIVVLNRLSGEGSDVPKTMLGAADGSSAEWPGKDGYNNDNKMPGARNWDDHYLQLDADEVSMLQMVMSEFDNVIILLNTNTQLEIGFMNDPGHYLFSDNDFTSTKEEAEAEMAKLKASLFCSYPGSFGAAAISGIIDGTINPSGKLADTWMRDFKLDPTWQNQGYGEVANGCATGTNTGYTQNNFVHYDEDIYLGYRYYETRFVEDGATEGKFTTSGKTSTNNGSITDQSFSTTTTEWDSWYDAQVLYPFGYGLSYTDFTFSDVKVTGAITEKGTITAEVKVTNTGAVAGKEVVQLYYSAPYYDGEIQKSHVELGGFAKTQMLAPGASEKVKIEMPVEYMKSYDWSDANNNGIKGYELDKGTYSITLATDAHEAAKLIESNTVEIELAENIHFKNDLVTGQEVVNIFDYSSGKGFTNTVNSSNKFKGVQQYLMRNDFEKTWPTHATEKKALYNSIGLVQVIDDPNIAKNGDNNQLWTLEEEVSFPNQAEVAGTAYTNKIKMWHMTGRDYEDPLWEKFLDQLTPEEMAIFVGTCNYASAGIDSIDKPNSKDNDGALGAKQTVSIQWPSNTIVAGTFNTDLSYLHGRLFANSAHFPKDGNYNGGIYGTGVETHRSPFAGRNAEYYAECPILSGLMAAPFTIGSDQVGVFVTMKHFGLNNCDTMRGSISTWASEQAIRQIHNKAYEICVKEGKTNAIMSATNYVGDQSAATCYPLLNTLLRDEWGFVGFVLSDMTARDPELSLRAGNDLQLQGNPNNPLFTKEAVEAKGFDWNTQLYYLRLATKNLLYVFANTQIMNGYGGDGLDNMLYTGSSKLQVIQSLEANLNINKVSSIIEDTAYSGQKYELVSGSTMPEGLTLNSDGTITGKAKTPGVYKFTVNIKEDIKEANIIGDKTQDSTRYEGSNRLDTVAFAYKDIQQTFTITVIPESEIPTGIVYSSSKLDDIATGYEYYQNIATGIYYHNGEQKTDISYKLATGSTLPSGLTLNNGAISGVCTAGPGEYKFSITASVNDNSGKPDRTVDFVVSVKQYGITFDKTDIAASNVGDTLNVNIATATTNSGNAIVYKLKDGSTLPKGLTLGANGMITGKAVQGAVDHEFTIIASSQNAASVEATYTITVNGIVANDKVIENLIYGKMYEFQLDAFHSLDDSATVKYALKDSEGNALPRGFGLTEDGKLAGEVRMLDDVSFIVVCTSGDESVEIVITIKAIDLDTESPGGTVVPPLDIDSFNTKILIQKIAIGGSIAAAVAVAGAAAFYFLVLKKKKANQ